MLFIRASRNFDIFLRNVVIHTFKTVIKRFFNVHSNALHINIGFRNMPGILHDVHKPCQKATFGMGCFWANDALFGATPGVLRTKVGYSAGTTINPTYKNM